MRAKDFRTAARWALRGNWGISVVTYLAVLALGGATMGATLSNLIHYSVNGFPAAMSSQYYGYSLFSFFTALLNGLLVAMSLGQLVGLVLGGPMRLGLCQYNLRLVLRTDRPSPGALFFRFHIFGKAFLLHLVFTVAYTLLGLLPQLPLWVARYTGHTVIMQSFTGNLLVLACYAAMVVLQLNYGMAPYLMSQNPSLGVGQSLAASRQMMRGNKGRLFCLQLSFVGWMLLTVFTCTVGLLWVMAYMAAAEAAFYLEVSGQLPPQAWQPVYNRPPAPPTPPAPLAPPPGPQAPG